MKKGFLMIASSTISDLWEKLEDILKEIVSVLTMVQTSLLIYNRPYLKEDLWKRDNVKDIHRVVTHFKHHQRLQELQRKEVQNLKAQRKHQSLVKVNQNKK